MYKTSTMMIDMKRKELKIKEKLLKNNQSVKQTTNDTNNTKVIKEEDESNKKND